jgi:RHS repeat-associated protein
MAAIDRGANVIEIAESTAFGELANLAPRLNHQFAGEYWDGDSRLVQLRARWYGPSEGRFLSLDPSGGRSSAPATLNRYAYASGDPLHITDPSGGFSMGDVGAGLNISMNLALRAYNVYDFLSMLAPDEEKDDVDGKPTLWDGMAGELVRAVFGGGSAAEAPAPALAGLIALAGAGGPRHHTIPEYVCGASAQERVVLPYSDHVGLHTKLYGLHLAVKVGARVFDMLFRKKNRGEVRSPVAQLARTGAGRMAIAEALHAFYESEGYWGMGVSERGARFGALGSVFLRERARFTGTHHSYPSCKKR